MVRTRFAPSPTGSLHVGNVRMAVLNWLFARRHGGAFILRIEDTDRARNVEGAEAVIDADLAWLGLDWDEGPVAGEADRGGHGPYRQTERLAVYREFADRLRAAGRTYDCWCEEAGEGADDEVERTGGGHADAHAQAQGNGFDGGGSDGFADGDASGGGALDSAAASSAPTRQGRPAVRCTCETLDAATIAGFREAGRHPALRFRVGGPRTITVHDQVYGDVDFDAAHIADFVVLRPDGVPTYNFAVVVDDVTMAVTHVIRGVGHLSNTPRQLLLYEALGEAPPVFAHVPMVLGPDRQKLSKRHGARAVADYRAEGYHPDGVVNYLSLLAWSSPSGDEVLERDRLIAEIDLARIGVADVVFDPQKLRWLSAQHIARMPLDALVEACAPFLDPALPIEGARLPAAIAAIRTHLTTFADVREHMADFFPDGSAPPLPAGARAVLDAVTTRLAASDWQDDALTAAIRAAGKDAGVGGRALYEPLRLALTGRAHGPPLAAVLVVQGRERALAALEAAKASVH